MAAVAGIMNLFHSCCGKGCGKLWG